MSVFTWGVSHSKDGGQSGGRTESLSGTFSDTASLIPHQKCKRGPLIRDIGYPLWMSEVEVQTVTCPVLPSDSMMWKVTSQSSGALIDERG